MSSLQLTSRRVLCFFSKCKYRQDEGQCAFSGPLIISIEGDCQCMERKRIEIAASVTENVGCKF